MYDFKNEQQQLISMFNHPTNVPAQFFFSLFFTQETVKTYSLASQSFFFFRSALFFSQVGHSVDTSMSEKNESRRKKCQSNWSNVTVVASERLSSEFMALECVQAMFIVSVEFQKRLTCHLCVVVFEIRSSAGAFRGHTLLLHYSFYLGALQ